MVDVKYLISVVDRFDGSTIATPKAGTQYFIKAKCTLVSGLPLSPGTALADVPTVLTVDGNAIGGGNTDLSLGQVSAPYIFSAGKHEVKAVATSTKDDPVKFAGEGILTVDVAPAPAPEPNTRLTVNRNAEPKQKIGVSQEQEVRVWVSGVPASVAVLVNGKEVASGGIEKAFDPTRAWIGRLFPPGAWKVQGKNSTTGELSNEIELTVEQDGPIDFEPAWARALGVVQETRPQTDNSAVIFNPTGAPLPESMLTDNTIVLAPEVPSYTTPYNSGATYSDPSVIPPPPYFDPSIDPTPYLKPKEGDWLDAYNDQKIKATITRTDGRQIKPGDNAVEFGEKIVVNLENGIPVNKYDLRRNTDVIGEIKTDKNGKATATVTMNEAGNFNINVRDRLTKYSSGWTVFVKEQPAVDATADPDKVADEKIYDEAQKQDQAGTEIQDNLRQYWWVFLLLGLLGAGVAAWRFGGKMLWSKAARTA